MIDLKVFAQFEINYFTDLHVPTLFCLLSRKVHFCAVCIIKLPHAKVFLGDNVSIINGFAYVSALQHLVPQKKRVPHIKSSKKFTASFETKFTVSYIR